MLSVLCVVALAGAVSGSPASRVYGGSLTTIDQYPYVAALFFSSSDVTTQHVGTATLINNRSALSLATWVYDMNTAYAWYLRCGSTNYTSGGDFYTVQSVIYHPNWSYDPLTSDLTIMRVATEFVFGTNVQSTPIAGPAYILPEGTAVTTVGWGRNGHDGDRSEQLRAVQIETINQETCRSTWEDNDINIASDMMCAGVSEGGKGLCAWDFGSPLIHDNVLIGVASYSQECGDLPSLYTRVSNFTEWITENA